jgi:glycosyltransferase involved in cell wall biosynthesis
MDEYRPSAKARRKVRQELGISEDAPVVGYVARFHPQKDHGTFVAAAGLLALQMPNTHFVLCGDGMDSDNAQLSAWVRRAAVADRCHLIGRRSDVQDVTAAFDVATLASAYGEGFPNIVGEALACGVPCVVTDVGDAAFIVGNDDLVVPPGDPQALFGAWERVLTLGPGERQALGTAGRERIAEHFSLDAMVSRYEALYHDIAQT